MNTKNSEATVNELTVLQIENTFKAFNEGHIEKFNELFENLNSDQKHDLYYKKMRPKFGLVNSFEFFSLRAQQFLHGIEFDYSVRDNIMTEIRINRLKRDFHICTLEEQKEIFKLEKNPILKEFILKLRIEILKEEFPKLSIEEQQPFDVTNDVATSGSSGYKQACDDWSVINILRPLRIEKLKVEFPKLSIEDQRKIHYKESFVCNVRESMDSMRIEKLKVEFPKLSIEDQRFFQKNEEWFDEGHKVMDLMRIEKLKEEFPKFSTKEQKDYFVNEISSKVATFMIPYFFGKLELEDQLALYKNYRFISFENVAIAMIPFFFGKLELEDQLVLYKDVDQKKFGNCYYNIKATMIPFFFDKVKPEDQLKLFAEEYYLSVKLAMIPFFFDKLKLEDQLKLYEESNRAHIEKSDNVKQAMIPYFFDKLEFEEQLRLYDNSNHVLNKTMFISVCKQLNNFKK